MNFKNQLKKYMKNLLLSLTAFAAIAFMGCSKEEGDATQKTIEVKVKTGDTFQFGEMIDDIVEAPNEFYAEVVSNGIKGIHDGITTAKVRSGGILYDCKIVVSAKNTLYIDLKYLLGMDKDSIIKLYGDPIKQEEDTYLFNALPVIGLEKGNIFVFKDNKVQIAMITFSSSYAKQMGAHLADRYILATTDGTSSILYVDDFSLDNWRVGVLVRIDTSTISAMYASRNYIESSSQQKISSMLAGILEENLKIAE